MSEKLCGKPGHAEYVWPGRADKSVICADHLSQLHAVADAMGFQMYIELNEDVKEKTCGQIISEG